MHLHLHQEELEHVGGFFNQMVFVGMHSHFCEFTIGKRVAVAIPVPIKNRVKILPQFKLCVNCMIVFILHPPNTSAIGCSAQSFDY